MRRLRKGVLCMCVCVGVHEEGGVGSVCVCVCIGAKWEGLVLCTCSCTCTERFYMSVPTQIRIVTYV